MIKKRAKFFIFSGLVLAYLIIFLATHSFSALSDDKSSDKDLELLGRVIDLIKNHYFEEPRPYETMEGAFKGVINSLDTLSSYLNQDNAEKFRMQRESHLSEAGMILYKREYTYYPQIVGIIKDSPAAEGGFRVGDLVIAIDDQSTRMMSMLEANLELKREEETNVKLRFIRRGQTREATIKIQRLKETPFSYSAHKGTSGILKIHNLYPTCVAQIQEEVLSRIKSQEKPLILDLRNCSEGDMDEALKMTNLFLMSEEVGYFESRKGEKEILSCPEVPELESLPLVIWVNQGTVGPAEAVAAILRENRKAKILGLLTPGLVAKLDFIALEDGSALLLTSSIFALKSGKSIWGTGLTPDVIIQGQDQSDETYLKETVKLISGP